MSQTIDVEVGPGAISPEANTDIEKFEKMLAGYLAGEIDEDRFRIFRLNNGIYGQRQGGQRRLALRRIRGGGGPGRPAQRRDLQELPAAPEEEGRAGPALGARAAKARR